MMRTRRCWLLAAAGCALLSTALSACLTTVREPDCLVDGKCECKQKSDCKSDLDCIDGKCVLIPDAGKPGDFGTPCATDADCFVGPCLPKGPGNGKVCTMVCGTGTDAGFSCPRGWECKTSFAADAGQVCTPPFRALCLGCKTDSDCNAAGDRCLTLPGGERACGQDCAHDACPSGYDCRSVLLDAGVARQCVADAGTCECSPISRGLKRSCKTQNTIGTCFGFETCRQDSSWSGCDARLASREICDGIDDDCNGLADQDDPGLDTTGVPGFPNCRKGLTCTGLWYCGALPGGDAGFGFLCSAPDPRQELCNGVDDDCNGQVDDGLRDSTGRYTSVRACGSCNTDCLEVLHNLATDGGIDAGALPGSAACVDRAGQLTCVPLQCEKGYYPSPPGTPQICERAVTSECRACTTTADCVVPGDQCVTMGTDPGQYCAQSCDPSGSYKDCTGAVGTRDCCPTDTTCRLVGSQKLCVPNGSSCQCTPPRAGFTRSCFKTRGPATCVGQQTCDMSGSYGVCDTSQTTIELCDALDNDCDGVVDNGFINTRGTGTYDTDEHCGNCSTNCKVRWSATIQHAIGGCLPGIGLPPKCAIVQCTTETVGGGGACRLDSECSGGRVCHPLYRQCVKACSTALPCGSGEQCVGGFCTRNCSSSTDCQSAYGQPSTCGAGNVCGVTYQFNDANLDETDGCECPAAQGVTDEPDVYASYPTAGLPYVDRDCDGVDGHAANSLFVWAQSTASRGTRAQPYRTMAEAIAAFNPAVHSAILVAQGTYVEQVVLRSGVAIYGGYSSDFSKRDVITFPTLIEAPEPDLALPGSRRGSVNAEGLAGRTVLAGFTIRGYDVTSRPAPGQPARNSYAMYVKSSPGLVIQNNHVVGGRGGDAIPGQPGPAGANGDQGTNGLPTRECSTPNCTSETQGGGSPGSNGSCPGATQGTVGAGSDLQLDPQQYPQGGNNGRGGSNGTYQHSDPSQNAYCKYDCIVPADGLTGGAARNGGDGSPGGGGQACTVASGQIVGDDWLSNLGTQGTNGSAGRGGGGGGAGGCVRNTNPATCTIGHLVGDLGGTGGGGGAGGCGGSQGFGAAGGGASFAIFIVGGAPSIDGNLIDSGFGGYGGNGGAGGYGGLGGQGGRGGPNTTLAWCAGQGGPGGRGGNGGAGAGGGAGCGGSVFGIGGQGIGGANYTARNTFAAAPLNSAGAGGVGGASPAGSMFKGGDGAPGIVVTVQSF